jgi:hypothetical protein
MEALSFSETSVLTRATRRNIPEDAILQVLKCKFLGRHNWDTVNSGDTWRAWIWVYNISKGERNCKGRYSKKVVRPWRLREGILENGKQHSRGIKGVTIGTGRRGHKRDSDFRGTVNVSGIINRRQQKELCKIWGFHAGDFEEWRLLGCYVVWLL